MWSGSIASIPTGWALCNGSNGTPDLRDKFVVGAGNGYSVAATGGSADAVVVSHSHGLSGGSVTLSGGSATLSGGSASGTFLNSASLTDSKQKFTVNTTTGTEAVTSVSLSTGNGSVSYSSPTVSYTQPTPNYTRPTVDSEGVSGTNANLPPYYAIAFIMRTT